MRSTLDTLRSFPLFGDLSAAEVASLAALVEEQVARAGEPVFHEGAAQSDVFFVVEGEVEFLMADPGGGPPHRIASSGPGEMFGEMAWLDDSARSATARAARDTRLLRLRKQSVAAHTDGAVLEARLTRAIARTIAARLKRENRNLVAAHERERQAQRRQHEFGAFFIYVLASYSIGMLVNRLLVTRLSGVNLYADVFTWSYLGVLLVPAIVLIARWRIPLDRLGVTLQGWRRSLREGLLASLALGLLAAAVVLVVRATGVATLKPPDFTILHKPEYLVHSYGQELLARGLLQGSLQRFFGSGGALPVLLSSALFALLHIHFGFAAVALTFGSGVALGLLYLRHENLLGVTLFHWAMGAVAFLSGLL